MDNPDRRGFQNRVGLASSPQRKFPVTRTADDGLHKVDLTRDQVGWYRESHTTPVPKMFWDWESVFLNYELGIMKDERDKTSNSKKPNFKRFQIPNLKFDV